MGTLSGLYNVGRLVGCRSIEYMQGSGTFVRPSSIVYPLTLPSSSTHTIFQCSYQYKAHVRSSSCLPSSRHTTHYLFQYCQTILERYLSLVLLSSLLRSSSCESPERAVGGMLSRLLTYLRVIGFNFDSNSKVFAFSNSLSTSLHVRQASTGVLLRLHMSYRLVLLTRVVPFGEKNGRKICLLGEREGG